MKRIISLLVVMLMVVSLAGCSAQSKDKDITAIKDAIITDLAITGANDIPDKKHLDRYGIALEDMEVTASFSTMGDAFPHEVIMVKAVDEDAADRVEERLNNRLESFMNQARNYDQASYALAQSCQVIREETVVALFLSPEHDAMEEIFSSHAG